VYTQRRTLVLRLPLTQSLAQFHTGPGWPGRRPRWCQCPPSSRHTGTLVPAIHQHSNVGNYYYFSFIFHERRDQGHCQARERPIPLTSKLMHRSHPKVAASGRGCIPDIHLGLVQPTSGLQDLIPQLLSNVVSLPKGFQSLWFHDPCLHFGISVWTSCSTGWPSACTKYLVSLSGTYAECSFL
jgi:hypothetical protein